VRTIFFKQFRFIRLKAHVLSTTDGPAIYCTGGIQHVCDAEKRIRSAVRLA